MQHFWPRVARWALPLMAASWLGAVCAQTPAPAGNEPSALHRFVGADGLGISYLKRSDIEALWGRAEVERSVTPTSGDAHERKPWLVLEYKNRGLSFNTPPGSYGQADPPISHATFTAPFEGCTPQGLCMGMPQDAALALISKLYKVKGDPAVKGGRSGRLHYARNTGWRETHLMSFGFAQGRLHSMSFQLHPAPLISMPQFRSDLAGKLGLVVLALVAMGVAILRGKLRPAAAPKPTWEAWRLGLGSVLLVGGTIGMILGFGGLSGSGDGYAKMAGLMMGLMAAGLVIVALLLFSGSRIAAVSRSACAILLFGVIAVLVSKLF